MNPSAATSAAVETRGLGRRFGRHWALAHVDLRVDPGATVLLAGPNGCGKTTLLRLLAGLSRPTLGSVRVFDLDPHRDRLTGRGTLSLVSHHSYLYDRLTALETLRMWARLLGRSSADAELLELLGEVGLGRRHDTLVGGFSAGMRKRLTLARIRLEEPRLVLLDEPLAALDQEGRKLVERWLAEHRRRGTTVIMASHALERMSRVCDRAVLLDQGQIAWEGPGDGLLERIGESTR